MFGLLHGRNLTLNQQFLGVSSAAGPTEYGLNLRGSPELCLSLAAYLFPRCHASESGLQLGGSVAFRLFQGLEIAFSGKICTRRSAAIAAELSLNLSSRFALRLLHHLGALPGNDTAAYSLQLHPDLAYLQDAQSLRITAGFVATDSGLDFGGGSCFVALLLAYFAPGLHATNPRLKFESCRLLCLFQSNAIFLHTLLAQISRAFLRSIATLE
mmetsp:Transcript_3690/g.6520  ORF Transcript_3690/g.6520 Transcript_3690/m.6520 type:complete len:213 (-) Transcript_3690:241-879(-)